MTVIAASVETLASGQPGTWFSVTGSRFIADVDTPHMVRLETRRSAGDAATKKVGSNASGSDTVSVLVGPCSLVVACLAGRQYRFVSVAGAASVAADQ